MLRAEIDNFEKAVRHIQIREFIKKIDEYYQKGGTGNYWNDIKETYNKELEC